MARVDCSQYFDDDLYNDAFSGVDHSGILLHSATLLGQGLAVQSKCAPPSHSVLAESSGKVQCQGDGNCGFYSVLNGLRSHDNEDTRFFYPLSDVRRLKERIADVIVRYVTVGLVQTVAQLTTQGAVYVSSTRLTVDGRVNFSDNSANYRGGAVYANFSDIAISGCTLSNNSASTKGGAIFAGSSTVFLDRNTIFAHNKAYQGGAIAGEESGFNITSNGTYSVDQFGHEGSKHGSTGNVAFIENTAVGGGGAMHVVGYNYLHANNATFKRNTAEVGGAVFVAASADKDSAFTTCLFDDNEAADGGAVYLYTGTGSDTFTASIFRDNFAKFSGGAIFHTGSLHIAHAVFSANKAGSDGPAVMSIGLLEELSHVSFLGNAYHCPAGEYGFINKTEAMKSDVCSVCFDEVCSRCSTGGGDVINNDSFIIDGEAVCKKAPPGTQALSGGTTLSTLVLREGYYRTSDQSHIVLGCYRKEACPGGIPPENICAVGYKGPYCSVCTEGFASGISYSCGECSNRSKRLAVGVWTVVGLVLLVMGGILSWRLGSVGGEWTTEGTDVARSSWGQNPRPFATIPTEILPLTAIKIAVTVWQIIHQFAAIAGDVYPEAYANFVLKLTPINLDIGFMLSYSCLVTTDFYDRLLISTIMPPVVLVALLGSYQIGKRRNIGSEFAVSVVKHRHQSAALLLAFWVYSSVSYTIFQTFSCDSLDEGKAYLRADYSLECSTAIHSTFKTYAWVMMGVYTVGIPALFAWCLARNRKDLTNNPERETLPHLEALNTLWTAYKPSRYFFELVECARRITLTGIAAFVLPNSAAQISIVLLVAVAFVFVSESIAPFKEAVDANLYRWGNGVIVTSLYVALLLKVDLANETEESISAFSGVLIAANIVMIVTVLVQTALLAKQWCQGRARVRPIGAPVRRASSL